MYALRGRRVSSLFGGFALVEGLGEGGGGGGGTESFKVIGLVAP